MKLIHLRKYLLLFFSMVLSAGLILPGCGGTTPPPTTSAPPTDTSPTGPLGFASGRYSYSQTYNDIITVAVSNTDDTVSIGIKARTTGWVAIALSPGLNKPDSDLWIGFVSNDGQVTLLDSFNPGYSGNHPLDSILGGTNSLFAITGSEVNGITTIEFKRNLTTGDARDIRLFDGVNAFIWAIGTTDNTFEEHSFVGFGEMTISIQHG
ncbi:DOMON domain-containing protein [Dehalogenimonas sp. THU2]|uniref:DOMON domain-containing protein n=1 Tax=Dehalogenimonas sp. THU2 TaxID=3151121 RepID=UPI00321854BE